MLKSPNGVVSPAKKIMLTLVGGSGLVLLGGGAIIFGLNSKLTSLQTTAMQSEKEVGSSEQIAKRYQATKDSFNETQGRIQFLESAVTSKSYVPTLLKQLQTLALATNLNVTSVRPGAPPSPVAPAAHPSDSATPAADVKKVAPPPYDIVPIDVDMTGSYANTATFLYSLTRFPKIIAVVGAQLHPNGLPPGSSPTASPTVTTNLHLVAFMFHEDASTAPTLPGSPAVTTASMPANGPVDVSKIDPAAGRVERGALAASKTSSDRIGQNRTAVGSSSL